MAAVTPEPRRRSSYLAAFSTVRSRRLAPPRTHMTAASRRELDQLAAHTWHVMFVGPLWGMRMTNKRELTAVLRRLERLVRLELDQTTEYKGMAVEAAVVDALLDGHSSVPCLRLTVRAPGRPAPLAELLLCNDEPVGRTLPASCEGQCVWLPLAFCRGAAAILDTVCARLRAVYGTSSLATGFTQDDLRWMAAMWGGQAGASRGVALEYRTPEAVAAALTVTLELPCDQMRLIWARVHDATLPEMSREEMDRFHRVLAAEANNAVGLPLGALDLSRLVTPLATVYADGRIRFTSGEAMDRCLGFLRQLAREFFDA